MKSLLDKMFPSQIDAIAPMVRAERKMYWEEKEKVAVLLAALEGLINTPAKDTQGINEAWGKAYEAIALVKEA